MIFQAFSCEGMRSELTTLRLSQGGPAVPPAMPQTQLRPRGKPERCGGACSWQCWHHYDLDNVDIEVVTSCAMPSRPCTNSQLPGDIGRPDRCGAQRLCNSLVASQVGAGGSARGRLVAVPQVMVKDVLLSVRPLVRVAKAMDPMAPMPSES
jgi:hypothetical protein